MLSFGEITVGVSYSTCCPVLQMRQRVGCKTIFKTIIYSKINWFLFGKNLRLFSRVPELGFEYGFLHDGPLLKGAEGGCNAGKK